MDGAFIIEDRLDIFTIAKPVKEGSPEIAAALAHAPTAGAGFTWEGVLETFSGSALTGSKFDGPKSSATHDGIKDILAGGLEEF